MDNIYQRKRQEYRRRYVAQNKEKIKAHDAVKRAIKKGTLIRPKVCSSCGKHTTSIELHHEDYSRPLEVVPLCILCHKRLHALKARESHNET